MTATSYNFSTTRTDLSLEPGWARSYGDAGALFPTSGILNRGATATAEHLYVEGSSVSGTTQKAGMTFGTAVGSTVPRLVVFGSGSAGAFTGYELYPSGSGTLRVVRTIAGAQATVTGLSTISVTTNALYFLEVITGGGTSGGTLITVYDGGGANIISATDSTASRPSSGFNGIRSVSSSASSVNVGQTFQGNLQDGVAASSAGGMLLMGCGS